jgi:transcriptional regulator with XRE-family HTH domain
MAQTKATTLNEAVLEEIRALLARRRMTARQLAAALGEHEVWLSRRMTGRQLLDLNEVQRIAAALDVGLSALLPAGRVTDTYAVESISGNLVSAGVRPPDRRPPGHPSTHIPPSSLTRTARTQPAFAA